MWWDMFLEVEIYKWLVFVDCINYYEYKKKLMNCKVCNFKLKIINKYIVWSKILRKYVYLKYFMGINDIFVVFLNDDLI